MAVLLRRLAFVLVFTGAILSAKAHAEGVVARFHFAGADELSRQTNYTDTGRLLRLPTSLDFKKRVLHRFADFLATGLPGATASSAEALAPLLDQWLGAESVVVAGGPDSAPLQFVAALRLANVDPAWNAALTKACGSTGAAFKAKGADGSRWGGGPQSLWLLPTQGWILVGRGDGLAAERDQFLSEIQKQGRPGTPLGTNCFEADVDWPRLQHWLPISFGPLKLARTKIELAATPDQILRMTAKVIYPEPISWHPQPWTPPAKLVFWPLVSFTAGQDLAAFMDNDVFKGLPGDPFTQQLYCWAMGEMPFQSYMAWPVQDATNLFQQLTNAMPPALNPELKQLNDGHVIWSAARHQIGWQSPMLRIVSPVLSPARSDNQPFMLCELFPEPIRHTNAPSELYDQFTKANNVVYYDWEVTGKRLDHWRLLGNMFPIIKRITADEMRDERAKVIASTNLPVNQRYLPSFRLTDRFLEGIAPHMNTETITEISMTGPAELTIKRRSPFVFSAFEWELLAHWLANAHSTGQLDPSLMPPKAKVTGPGVPRH